MNQVSDCNFSLLLNKTLQLSIQKNIKMKALSASLVRGWGAQYEKKEEQNLRYTRKLCSSTIFLSNNYSKRRCLMVLLLFIIELSAFIPIRICSSTKLVVTFLSLSSVFIPSACKGMSDTKSKAPIGIEL